MGMDNSYPAYTRANKREEWGSQKAMCLLAIHRKEGKRMDEQRIDEHTLIRTGWFRPNIHKVERFYHYVPDNTLNPGTSTNRFYDRWYQEVVAYERANQMQFDRNDGMFSEEILTDVFGVTSHNIPGFPDAYTI